MHIKTKQNFCRKKAEKYLLTSVLLQNHKEGKLSHFVDAENKTKNVKIVSAHYLENYYSRAFIYLYMAEHDLN